MTTDGCAQTRRAACIELATLLRSSRTVSSRGLKRQRAASPNKWPRARAALGGGGRPRDTRAPPAAGARSAHIRSRRPPLCRNDWPRPLGAPRNELRARPCAARSTAVVAPDERIAAYTFVRTQTGRRPRARADTQVRGAGGWPPRRPRSNVADACVRTTKTIHTSAR
jgi:hypothetical protein